MLFEYKAKSKDGILIEGTMDAKDRFSVSKELRLAGNVPISINQKKEAFEFVAKIEAMFTAVKLSELIIMAKNLSGMIKAGLSIHRALGVIEKQTKSSELKRILNSLAAEINAGGTLSSGLAKFPKVFSSLFVSMVKAGEESGNLANSLLEISANLEKSYRLNRRVKGALIYPAIILSAMIVIGILMFAFVVPTLAKTFADIGVELPTSTRILIAIGNFFSNNLILSFVILAGTILGIRALLRASSMAKYVDYAILRIPMIGVIVKELNTARTARTMSSLLISGVPITRSIEITEDVVQNVYFKKVLREAKEKVEKGTAFSEIFKQNQKLYPIMMVEMIEVGEETGKLSDMLLQIAEFYEDEIETKTKNLSTIIEPFLMIIIGAGVGFFAISMITPMYSILDDIK